MSSVTHPTPEPSPDFAAFYAEWFPRNVAHVRLKYQLGREDAEDIVQNAFIGFLHAAPSLSERTIPEAKEFLHRRVFTASLDAPLFDDGNATLADVCQFSSRGLGTEDQAIFNIEMSEMVSLMGTFAPLWRFVLLRATAGYTLSEIHYELVTQQGYASTVKALQHVLGFARQALRQQHQIQKLQRRPKPARAGPWSTQFAACVQCGETKHRFAAHGLCLHCYNYQRWRAHKGKPTGRQRLTQWAAQYTACQECGTTERPHCARGYCRTCYKAVIGMPRRKAAAQRKREAS
jgi:hypothetical protein